MNYVLRKRIYMDGHVVRLVSIDAGRTWASRPSDLRAYLARYLRERRELQRSIALIDTSTGQRQQRY